MVRLLIIAPESRKLTGLGENLAEYGMACSITTYNNGVRGAVTGQQPDILLLETDSHSVNSEIRALVQRMKQGRSLPVIALISGDILDSTNGHLDLVDDFITSPYDARELFLRINRLIHKTRSKDSDELIKCDSLAIDLAKCEVTIEDKVVELTFKEYELLKLLASNRGRVYTRDALLERIWGYDYYGGDRTVDVHIRRLRSKIEVSGYTFVETVRNIGYRFRKEL